MQAETLTVTERGKPLNEYRLREGRVEFRSRVPGRGFEINWRNLTEDEILLHLRLSTPVAWWLLARRAVNNTPIRVADRAAVAVS